MNAYLPSDAWHAWLIAATLAACLLAGLAITRLRSATLGRVAAWSLTIGGAIAMERLCAEQPAGVRMVALIGVLLWSLKAVVTVEAQAAGAARLPPLRWLAFATFWPGMRPSLFVREAKSPLSGGGELIGAGLKRMAAGAVLMGGARWTWMQGPEWLGAEVTQGVATIFLLIAISLVLHFGLFNVLAGAWRLAGVDCRPLFRAPLRSRSLTEFWGRRWNLAFSEMTALAVYRPLAGLLGKNAATAFAFLFSGLLHEMAISVPVWAGFGLPMLYFALHGGLVLLERQLERIGRPIEKSRWLAIIWTLGWLVLPLPLLFHPWFLRGVVWPLIGVEAGDTVWIWW